MRPPRLLVTVILSSVSMVWFTTVPADHKPDHLSEGVGQIDTSGYNCTDATGQLLGATECMLMKLDRIERRIGCPIEDYLADTCTHSPADTTVNFCISQGREGAIGADFTLAPFIELEGGVGWPNAVWGKGTGKAEVPMFVPLGPIPVPVPTSAGLGWSASLGRNFDICIEVPLIAANHAAAGDLGVPDAEIIDRIVRAINEPVLDTGPSKSKFQRRLGRLANYAIFRVPGTNRFNLVATPTNSTALADAMDDDGESEFDLVDDAMDRIMSGDWQVPGDGGPAAMLKSPVVQDLSVVLELPEPVMAIIQDPDVLVGTVFETMANIGLPGGSAASTQDFNPAAICGALGLNTQLQDRFPAVGRFCGLFSSLPTFGQTTGIFNVVATIRNLVNSLPTLSEIQAASCEIAGWLCPAE